MANFILRYMLGISSHFSPKIPACFRLRERRASTSDQGYAKEGWNFQCKHT